MILGGGSDLFLSDAGIASVASDNACGAICVVEVLGDSASAVVELTSGLAVVVVESTVVVLGDGV